MGQRAAIWFAAISVSSGVSFFLSIHATIRDRSSGFTATWPLRLSIASDSSIRHHTGRVSTLTGFCLCAFRLSLGFDFTGVRVRLSSSLYFPRFPVMAPAALSRFSASSMVRLGTSRTVDISAGIASTERPLASVVRHARTVRAGRSTGYVMAHWSGVGLAMLTNSRADCDALTVRVVPAGNVDVRVDFLDRLVVHEVFTD